MVFNRDTNLRKKNSIKVIYPKYNENNEINYLSTSEISTLIDRKKSANDILTKLNDYYLGYNDILKRNNLTQDEINKGVTKPNNRLSHPYAYSITSLITGYFSGIPVRYVLPDKRYQVLYEKILDFNDSRSVDTSISIDESKFGYACEQLYLDEEANIRFNNIDPYNIIFVCDDNIDEEPWCVIKFKDRYSLEGQYTDSYDVEVYYEDKVEIYKNNFNKKDEEKNPFNDVPFILYENNQDFIGDYERVINLIDAYDLIESDRANDIEYNTDAFLFVKGVDIDSDEAIKMRKMRIFNAGNSESNADIKYIEKTGTASSNIQTYIEQINADIHKFSLTPDLNSEAFLASNASGTALKLKFQGLETLCKTKESYFEKGLRRRLELINNILNLKMNNDVNLINDTKIIFTRNTVDNVKDLIEQTNSLSGIVTKETQVEMLDGIIDASKELERLEEQNNLPYLENVNGNDNEDNLDKEKLKNKNS